MRQGSLWPLDWILTWFTACFLVDSAARSAPTERTPTERTALARGSGEGIFSLATQCRGCSIPLLVLMVLHLALLKYELSEKH